MTKPDFIHGRAGSDRTMALPDAEEYASGASRRHGSASDRIMASVEFEPNTGCWLSSASGPGGYTVVKWRGRHWLRHRLSWVVHRGDIPAGQCVLHKCDTPACCNPDHLFLGTNADNVADRERKGRGAMPAVRRGRAVNTAKVGEREVRAIRQAYQRGVPGHGHHALGKRFGLAAETVRAIVDRSTWEHVE